MLAATVALTVKWGFDRGGASVRSGQGLDIAYVTDQEGAGNAVFRWHNGRSWRMSGPRVLATAPAWDRCGRRLAYVTRDSAGGKFKLVVDYLNGSPPVVLFASTGPIVQVAWLPGDAALAIVNAPAASKEGALSKSSDDIVARVGLDFAYSVIWQQHDSEARIGRISVNPKSGLLTLGVLNNGIPELVSLERNGAVSADYSMKQALAPAWSPSGRSLALVEERASGWTLVSMGRDGKVDNLFTSARLLYAPSWASDGRRLVFERYGTDSSSDIWELDLQHPKVAHRLISGPTFEGLPTVRPTSCNELAQ
jgi:dipeptidyl aminopeptidase/acylaminoacyl peptidase